MRRMSKRLVAPLVAAALLLGTAVPAWGYFTAWDDAAGGIQIHKPGTRITEDYGDGEKRVVIENTGEVPVWVRAKVAIPADLLKKAVVEGSNWTATGNKMDWFTYDKVLQPGEHTDQLLVKITFPFTAKDVASSTTTGTDTSTQTGGESKIDTVTADGTTYNVVVVYEMRPVVYTGTAPNVEPVPAEWN